MVELAPYDMRVIIAHRAGELRKKTLAGVPAAKLDTDISVLKSYVIVLKEIEELYKKREQERLILGEAQYKQMYGSKVLGDEMVTEQAHKTVEQLRSELERKAQEIEKLQRALKKKPTPEQFSETEEQTEELEGSKDKSKINEEGVEDIFEY